MKQHSQAIVILILISAIWGATYPLIKLSATSISNILFVGIQCTLALVMLLPAVWLNLFALGRRPFYQGALLGLLNGSTFLFQNAGLHYIDPASSAFISGMGILLVPFLAPIFKLEKPHLPTYGCCLLGLYGLYLLTHASLKQNLIGVNLTLLGALCYAFYIIYLQRIKPSRDVVLVLTFYQVLSAGLLSFSLLGLEPLVLMINTHSIIACLFCGILGTGLAILLQARFQQFVPATQVVLIYSLEPLFASIWSYLAGLENIHLYQLVGGVLIILSIILNEYVVARFYKSF